MPHPCKQPGCPILIDDGSGTLCNKHRKAKEKHQHNKYGAKRLYSDVRWQKGRIEFLKAHPLCFDCERKGKTVVATEVHHTIRHFNNPTIFFDSTYWQGLCKSCHSKHTYRETIGAHKD